MSQHIIPASHSVKDFIDNSGITSVHGMKLLNAIAMDDPDAYKDKKELERLYRDHQKTDLKTQLEYIASVDERARLLKRRSPRRLATAIHEETDSSATAEDGSEAEAEDAISIAANDTLSKGTETGKPSTSKAQETRSHCVQEVRHDRQSLSTDPYKVQPNPHHQKCSPYGELRQLKQNSNLFSNNDEAHHHSP